MKKPPTNPAPDRLPVREKVAYGVGDVAFGLAVSSVGFWLLIYLTDVAGLGALLAGVAIMIGRIWDAVTDPIMGWITDHTNSRWGKRRPYLLFGAIPYGLAYFSLWVIPEFESEAYVFAWITVALLVFNTCLTVVFVPYTSLTAAITQDYDERTSLTGYRMFCSQSAFLLGAAIPSAIVLFVTSDAGESFLSDFGIHALFGSWSGTAREGYFIMAVLFMMIMVAALWTTFAGCRERDIAVKPSDDDGTPLSYATSILDELQGNKPFRISVALILFTNCAATLIAVTLPYFIQYVLQLKQHQTSIVSLLFVTAILCVPGWVVIARRFGKAESYRVAMLLYALTLCALPFLGVGNLNAAYVIAVLAGVFHSAALMLPWAIIPDVVEFDELRIGRRREGLFYGGTTFSYKLATALAVFLSGSVLEWIGYVPNQPQTAPVLDGIEFLIGPAAALFLVSGAIISLRYPLTAEKHKRIREELDAKAAG